MRKHKLGIFYTLRSVARHIGKTDPRTVHTVIVRERIPTGLAGRGIVIDAKGFDRIKQVYESERSAASA